MGHCGAIAMLVDQLVFSTTPLFDWPASGLISGITSGTVGSMRNADELSTTAAPALAAMGPYTLLIEPPALKNAMSMSLKLSSFSSSMVISRPAKVIVLPAERAEARRRRL